MPRKKQVAALPWRRGEVGVEILMITTRTTKRWVIPKGWPMEGKADHDAAAVEAFEEAGVQGVVSSQSFAHYGYLKVSDKGNAKFITVTVYALRVEQELEDWPERLERERRWVTAADAADLSGEPELVPVLQQFANHPPADDSVVSAPDKSPWQWLVDMFR
jgi:8-oxo-dGTP pyrophosphatase MutT (NUDIX family)